MSVYYSVYSIHLYTQVAVLYGCIFIIILGVYLTSAFSFPGGLDFFLKIFETENKDVNNNLACVFHLQIPPKFQIKSYGFIL